MKSVFMLVRRETSTGHGCPPVDYFSIITTGEWVDGCDASPPLPVFLTLGEAESFRTKLVSNDKWKRDFEITELQVGEN